MGTLSDRECSFQAASHSNSLLFLRDAHCSSNRSSASEVKIERRRSSRQSPKFVPQPESAQHVVELSADVDRETAVSCLGRLDCLARDVRCFAQVYRKLPYRVRVAQSVTHDFTFALLDFVLDLLQRELCNEGWTLPRTNPLA
jgi:hypothetical protein